MDLTVSQILSDTFAAMKRHFWGLFGLYLTFIAIIIAMVVVFMLAVGGSAFALAAGGADPAAAGAEMGAGMILLVIVFYLAYILVYCAQIAAMNRYASPLRPVGFGEALSIGFRSAPTLLLVMILLIIGYFIGAIVLGVVFGLLAQIGTAGTVVAALLTAGLVLWLASRLAIVFPLVPVEEVRNPITAITRSWRLTRGHALSIFLALLVFVVVALVLFGIALVPMMGMFTGIATGEPPSFGSMGLGFVLVLVVSILMGIAYAAFLSAIHARLAGSSEQLEETFG